MIVVKFFPAVCVIAVLGWLLGALPLNRRGSNGDVPRESRQSPDGAAQVPVQERQDAMLRDELPEKAAEIPESAADSDRSRVADVPFILQAPGGKWSDPLFQNGCEEASVAMALAWINHAQRVSVAEAEQQIRAITAFEEDRFGYSMDVGLDEVMSVFREYAGHRNVELRKKITIAAILAELRSGAIVLVPVFGRALHNPYFTAPGPVTHMLVITGYDDMAKQFIVHDPGTKRGASYRYGQAVLYDAIWRYPSGSVHASVPLGGAVEKGGIVVRRP